MICNRYERHATVITSNRDFNEWAAGVRQSASATMDRLVQRRGNERLRVVHELQTELADATKSSKW